MTNKTVLYPRLHALIGNIVTDVPEDVPLELECALEERQLPASRPTFRSCLNATRADNDQAGPTSATQTSPQQASVHSIARWPQ